MVISTGPPRIILPTTIYHNYFSHTETDTFRGHYVTVLAPYTFDLAKSVAAATSADVLWLIYATSHEGFPTAFLS